MPSKPSELQGIRKIGDPGTCRSNKNQRIFHQPTKVFQQRNDDASACTLVKATFSSSKAIFLSPLIRLQQRGRSSGKLKLPVLQKRNCRKNGIRKLDIWATPGCPSSMLVALRIPLPPPPSEASKPGHLLTKTLYITKMEPENLSCLEQDSFIQDRCISILFQNNIFNFTIFPVGVRGQAPNAEP